MSEIGLEPDQVVTASGHIYIYHTDYGICEIRQITLEPYLAIIKLQQIDDEASIAASGLRKLDFTEFERMGFAIQFRFDRQIEEENRLEGSPPWLLDETGEEEEEETYSDDDDVDIDTSVPHTSISRKRLHPPDLTFHSPVSEKKSRSIGSSNRRVAKYECTECDAAFSNSKHLRTHGIEFSHIGTIRPFQCDTCGTEFRWKEDRNMHVRLHHKQKESPWVDRIDDPTITLPIFQITPIRTFEESSIIMAFEATELSKKENSKICETVPQFCLGPAATYLVDLTKLNHPDDIVHDSYGSWGKCSGDNAVYALDYTKKTLTRLNTNNTCKRKYVGDEKVDLSVRRRCYRHPQEKLFRKTLFIGSFGEENIPRWAIVSYEWLCTPYAVVAKPHGNTKYKDKPFQPTAKSVRLLLKQRATNLTPKQNISLVGEQITKAIGPAFIPRDDEQARQTRHRIVRKLRGGNKQ